jgi:hypothetical protein
MATFILVHGTFSKSAHWPALQSALTQTSQAAGEVPAFKELTWSGKNRATARQAAASAILNLIQNIRLTSSSEKIFLIGHSHGGSAIAYFLKEHQDVAKTLSGCAFLSTPFVAIRPRSQGSRLASTLMVFPLCVVLMSLVQMHGVSVEGQDFMDAIVATIRNIWFVICLGLGFLVAAGLVAYAMFGRHGAENAVERTVRQQTADIPDGNYLFLRCSGDEAAAALSAIQFIAWLGMKVAKMLDVLFKPLYNSRRSVRITYFLVLTYVGGSTVDLAWTLIPRLARLGISGFFGFIAHEFSVGEGWPVSLMLIRISIPCLFVLCSCAAVLVLTTEALTTWAFGWTDLSTAFAVDLAVEPLPFGTHMLTHIDWTPGASPPEGIVHSWTYSHPGAIREIQDWVKAAL